MSTKRRQQAPKLARATGKCLAELLHAELSGSPVEAYVWRARNGRKIPLVDELTRNHMIDQDRHYVVTFLGLLCAPGREAISARSRCKKLFSALKKHLPAQPHEPASVEVLARQTSMTPDQILQSAAFLSRSLASLGINATKPEPRLFPNENYVTTKSFEELKDKSLRQYSSSTQIAWPPTMLTSVSDRGLMSALEASESDDVRQYWRKAVERTSRDPAGAITAARSLVETGCKYILEELGEAADTPSDLPKLYKKTAMLLRLDPRNDVNKSLRRVLQATATVIDGLAHLRNELGDAHGKSKHSARPAKRHAELIVTIAGAITAFLLSTLDAQRVP